MTPSPQLNRRQDAPAMQNTLAQSGAQPIRNDGRPMPPPTPPVAASTPTSTAPEAPAATPANLNAFGNLGSAGAQYNGAGAASTPLGPPSTVGAPILQQSGGGGLQGGGSPQMADQGQINMINRQQGMGEGAYQPGQPNTLNRQQGEGGYQQPGGSYGMNRQSWQGGGSQEPYGGASSGGPTMAPVSGTTQPGMGGGWRPTNTGIGTTPGGRYSTSGPQAPQTGGNQTPPRGAPQWENRKPPAAGGGQ